MLRSEKNSRSRIHGIHTRGRHAWIHVFFGLLCVYLLNTASSGFTGTLAIAAQTPPLEKRLVEQAQVALLNGKIPLAAALLRGARELSEDFAILLQLAQVNSMAGQFEEAAEHYRDVLKLNPPPETAKHARSEIERLKSMPAPFTDELLARVQVTDFAEEAFSIGAAYAKKTVYIDALRFLRAALMLDPTLPGTYRLLAAIHGKLKNAEKEKNFLQDYIRIRPDGAIADQIRKRLKPLGLLSSVSLAASYPCKIWVNGRPMGRETPYEALLLPSGYHTISFVSEKYHLVRNKRVLLKPGEAIKFSFDFGLLTIKLKPWARARANGKDLGLWEDLGLPEGTYQLSLTAFDKSKKKDMELSIQAGKQTLIDTW